MKPELRMSVKVWAGDEPYFGPCYDQWHILKFCNIVDPDKMDLSVQDKKLLKSLKIKTDD
jgi:hypothetical protein